MRCFQSVLISLLLLGIVLQESKAQNLYIELSDGSVDTDVLATIKNLSFAESNLYVNFIPGTSDVYDLSTIRKLYFNASVAINEPAETLSSLLVYPNPAKSSTITVHNNWQGTVQVNIFRSDGQLVLSSSVTDEKNSVNISGLAPGLYLLRAGNQTVKFIRQ